MPDTASEFARRGKQLPREERELLVDTAWSAEIERRLAAYDRGETQALSADEVFAKARAVAK